MNFQHRFWHYKMSSDQNGSDLVRRLCRILEYQYRPEGKPAETGRFTNGTTEPGNGLRTCYRIYPITMTINGIVNTDSTVEIAMIFEAYSASPPYFAASMEVAAAAGQAIAMKLAR